MRNLFHILLREIENTRNFITNFIKVTLDRIITHPSDEKLITNSSILHRFIILSIK